jgi:hypothetical protein
MMRLVITAGAALGFCWLRLREAMGDSKTEKKAGFLLLFQFHLHHAFVSSHITHGA